MWVERVSKTRNLPYLFNTKTGESKWLSSQPGSSPSPATASSASGRSGSAATRTTFAVSGAPGGCIVPDTNVFISALCVLERICADAAQWQPRRIEIVVPWMVIHELDGLKGSESREVASAAREAVRFIEAAFASKTLSVRGQQPDESVDAHSNDEYLGHVADDKILRCALYFHRQHMPVLLLSDDRNLRVKSMVHSVRASSTARFSMSFFASEPLSIDDTTTQGSVRGPPPPITTTAGTASTSTTTTEMDTDGEVLTGPAALAAVTADSDEVRWREAIDSAQYLLADSLGAAMLATMERQYGDTLEFVMKILPPWDARDVATLVDKDWLSVYSAYLPRESQLVAKSLCSTLREYGNGKSLLSRTMAFEVCHCAHQLVEMWTNPEDTSQMKELLRSAKVELSELVQVLGSTKRPNQESEERVRESTGVASDMTMMMEGEQNSSWELLVEALESVRARVDAVGALWQSQSEMVHQEELVRVVALTSNLSQALADNVAAYGVDVDGFRASAERISTLVCACLGWDYDMTVLELLAEQAMLAEAQPALLEASHWFASADALFHTQ